MKTGNIVPAAFRLLVIVVACSPFLARAQTPPTIIAQPQITSLSLLHSFAGDNDGANPYDGLIQGTDGRLYGTASAGGLNDNGTVFAVNPDGTGFTLLHSFGDGGNAGSNPWWGLIQGN